MRHRLPIFDAVVRRPKVGRIAWVTASGLGAVNALSFAPTGHASLQIAAFALFSMLLWRAAERGAGWRAGAQLGFAWAFGSFTLGVSWLFVSMHSYGGMPAPLAILALLAFCGYLAVFPTIACAIAIACWRSSRPWIAVITIAGAWTLAELLRGALFTGFPWLSTGYAQIDSPISAVAPWLGVHGVSLITVLFSSALGLIGTRAVWIHRSGLLGVLGCAGVAVGVLIACSWSPAKEAPVGSIRARLLQGNVPQDLKFDPDRTRAAMLDYIDAIDETPVDLTVLPETAWTVPWNRTPVEIGTALLERIARGGGRVAIGMPWVGEREAERSTPSITNSVAVLDANGATIARYDKRHLVPFGEFIPWGFRWFVNLMNIPLGDFKRGSAAQDLLIVGPERIAFNICYEDLFGHELAAQVRQGATILINATNIAWFGRSHALGQHLQIARMRSLELSRPMLRATNTGVTAAIDHRGRVIAQLPDHQRGALITQVAGQSGLTLFARWGQASVLIIASLIVWIGLVMAHRTRRD